MKQKRTTTKRVKSAEIEVAQRVKELRGEYPKLEEIYRVAGLLATSRRFSEEDPQTIAMRAVSLWDGCRFGLEEYLEDRAEIEPEVLAACEALNPYPVPKAEKFPAPLDEWLLKVVGGKDVGDREREFLKFLRAKPHLDQNIGRWKARGFESVFDWEIIATEFQRWHSECVSIVRRRIANDRWSGGAYRFLAGNLTDLQSLANKLQKRGRAIDGWVFSKLSTKSKHALESFHRDNTDANAAELRKALVRKFNQLIGGELLSGRQFFSEIKLRPETQILCGQNPKKEIRILCNRLLMEDAYPEELSKKLLFKK